MIQKYAEVEVPRYTSYPTAAQFRDGIDDGTYRTWLADVPADKPLSLYVHIPFCQSLCWYCACHTTIVHTYDRVADYLGNLRQELELLRAALPGRRTVSHVHFGGGTPTILNGQDFASFMDNIRESFAVSEDAEVAVEIDPRTLSAEMVGALASAGVSRASLGVQVLSPQVQRKINRIQPFDMVEASVDRLRRAGVDAINFDLMYGLPGQTADDVARSVKLCTALKPDRFAIFGYAHVPWFKKHQQCFDAADLPGTEERFHQASLARDTFLAEGYCAVGFDHFARREDALAVAAETGRLRRNFQGYTTDDASVLIGLGASSIGSLPGAYVQNASRLDVYRERVQSGQLASMRGVSLTCEDKLRRAVIEQIMCVNPTDVGKICEAYGYSADHLDASFSKLNDLLQDGMIRVDGRTITVTDRGRLFVRNVASRFDAYWSPSPSRHSQAV